MIILEPAKAGVDRKKKEKKWILEKSEDETLVMCNKSLTSGNTKFGYKLSAKTRRKQSEAKIGKPRPLEKSRAKHYQFIAPNGDRVTCRGLRKLCVEQKLNQGHLSRVARGLLSQHKGWTKA
jgi:hypothetical protein